VEEEEVVVRNGAAKVNGLAEAEEKADGPDARRLQSPPPE